MQRINVPTDRVALERRMGALGFAVLIWSACIGYRLLDLQIYRSQEMRGLARKQQEQVISLDARRGLLYDRSGRELAMSIEVDSVYAVPAEIDDPARTAAALAPALGVEAASIPSLTAKMTGDKLFAWLKRKVDPGTRAAVEALSLKGIGFASEHKRFYPLGGLGAHVMGWVGMDNKGMDGLELFLDSKVKGQNGQVFALRDARGRKFLKVTQREPVPGNNVVLTIHTAIQHAAERELKQAMRDTGAAAGTVIVMDPRTGDILALANEPTFNPNRPVDSGPDSRKNRAIVDAYEPGSTFKVITMAAALEKDLVRPAELFDCQNGAIRIGRALIRDHKPFGLLSATQILEQSSNVGAIKIGLRLDQADFHGYMRRFGLGARTGIDLPGEARGLMREPREWSGLSQATLSFGQEISVTPIQLVTAFSAVANGGVLQPPRIVMRELSARGEVVAESEPRASKRILKESTAHALTRMMMSVVDEGTAKSARLPGYSIAGKTGTAQKIGPEGTYAPNRFVASFVGFVPASRPALTILVVLDEPRGSLYHGGDIAAPVFRRIALPALRHLGVRPEEGRTLRQAGEPALVAAAHTRRWIEPVPLDEEELREEQVRRERLMQKEKLLQRRLEKVGLVEADVEHPVEPARKPLPSPASVVAGDEVLLADLQGHSLRNAVRYLSRVGLRARLLPPETIREGQPSIWSGDGVVVAQEPAAGSMPRRGAEVGLRPGCYLRPQPAQQEDREREEIARAGAVAPARRPMR